MVGPVRGDTGHRRLQTRHSRDGCLILGQTGHCQAEDAALAAGKGNDKTLQFKSLIEDCLMQDCIMH